MKEELIRQRLLLRLRLITATRTPTVLIIILTDITGTTRHSDLGGDMVMAGAPEVMGALEGDSDSVQVSVGRILRKRSKPLPSLAGSGFDVSSRSLRAYRAKSARL